MKNNFKKIYKKLKKLKGHKMVYRGKSNADIDVAAPS